MGFLGHVGRRVNPSRAANRGLFDPADGSPTTDILCNQGSNCEKPQTPHDRVVYSSLRMMP